MPCFSIPLCCRPKPHQTAVEKVYELFQDILDSSCPHNQKLAQLKATAEKYEAIYYIYFNGDTVTITMLKHYFRDLKDAPLRSPNYFNLGEREIKMNLNNLILNGSIPLDKKIKKIEHYRPYFDHVIRQVIFEEED